MGVLSRLLVFVPVGGDTINGFRNYLLSKGIDNDKSVKFYQMWVSQYLDFHKSSGKNDHKTDDIDQFISTLGDKYADWQLNHANEAVRAYFLFQAHETTPQDPSKDSTDTHWNQVAEEMVRMLRLKQRSLQTEKRICPG